MCASCCKGTRTLSTFVCRNVWNDGTSSVHRLNGGESPHTRCYSEYTSNRNANIYTICVVESCEFPNCLHNREILFTLMMRPMTKENRKEFLTLRGKERIRVRGTNAMDVICRFQESNYRTEFVHIEKRST